MQTVRRLISSFIPDHYTLSLTIDRPERRFEGLVTIEGVSPSDEQIRLHSKELSIKQITVDGHEASFTYDENDELVITTVDQRVGKHIVVIEFCGIITDQMHGMYPCYFKHDGVEKELIATQLESHHAREVFPCVDEPEAKATYDVILTTEPDVVVLGNMPVQRQSVEQGRLVTAFDRTPRMSSYLLAWVYGDLHARSAKTKRGVDVNVWATTAQKPESLDFALDFAVKTIDHFEEYFGVQYPLPKSDHVALPDFTSGAMENWGLITYREIALLADPDTSTIDSQHYVAMVVGHELSHQWFGNLVTMKWWDNLWLNESFANFIENLPINAMHPDWGIWMDYASSWSLMAMRRDAIEGVQPVQTDVNHPDEIGSLFDGAIVYGKGGRLIGMLREYVGEEDFKKGLNAYFVKYAFQNTTGDDLWDCLEHVSGKPVRDFMNKWVLRAGYPVAHVHPDGLEQERFFIGEHTASDEIWPIPLAASPSGDLPAVLDSKRLEAKISTTTRLNVGNWSHFVTNYSDEHFTHLLDNMSGYEPLDRLQLINERVLLTRSAHVMNASLVSLLKAMKGETNESVWGILSLAFSELKKFVEFDDVARSKLKTLARILTHVQFERLGWEGPADEPENDKKLRPLILGIRIYGEDASVIRAATDHYAGPGSIQSLNPELRGLILDGKVKSGLNDQEFNELLQAYVDSSSSAIREDIIGALTSTQIESQLHHLLDSIKDPNVIRPQDATHCYVYLIRSRYAKTAAWRWLRDNWDWVVKTYGGDKTYDDFVRYSAGGLTTRDELDEFTTFFTPLKDQPALTRVIELGIAEIKARVELIESQRSDVIDALNQLD